MKKLKKLSLAQLANDAEVLCIDEQQAISGGYAGIDGLCYFEALAYLAGVFNCEGDINTFINAFAAANGGYGSIMTVVNGQVVFNGVSPEQALEFTDDYFDAEAIDTSEIASKVAAGGKVLTDIKVGNGTSHAVTITGYNSATDMYSYYDAADGQTKEVSGSGIQGSFAMSIDGCN